MIKSFNATIKIDFDGNMSLFVSGKETKFGLKVEDINLTDFFITDVSDDTTVYEGIMSHDEIKEVAIKNKLNIDEFMGLF